ncbi:ABC transporter ATP-binding protein [Sporosalibacterium faouarense]|uniref:ABC transporter ATP-binding protein n=1 Tax=Sporosalibacterium faouarense TaxID=516123 RepID=UPI00192BDD1D|nr:ABC transporter ATP-binding protein [Sporosalibacterium faouarense]
MKNKDKHKKISPWSMMKKIFPQILSVSPGLFIFNSFVFVLDGASFAATILSMQILFDRVTDLAQNKGTIKEAVLALMLLFGIKVFQQIVSGVSNFIGETYDSRSKGKLSHIINLKMSKLDPVSFENAETLDDINKSYNGVKFAINFINTIVDTMTLYLPHFLFMGIYLFNLKPILAVSLVFVFLPVLITQIVRVKIFSRLEDFSAPLRRKGKYYEECMTGRKYVKETRILGANPYFMNLLRQTIEQMNNLKWKADIKANLVELGTKLISLFGYLCILWMLFDALMKQEITLGAFAAVFASISSMFDMMEEIVCERLGYYAKNFGKIQNYLRFLELPERDENKKYEEDISYGDITLENVSFSYPNGENNALDGINLTIKDGETIAIVGENGSGKSTLIRLLTGLYLPDSGNVLHNNVDTRAMTTEKLFKDISGIFQNYQKYQLSLKDNITISETGNKFKGKERIKHVTSQAGINLKDNIFNKGFKTMLSREFDGVDLSGGQWQRVAIARGLFRVHKFIILDEPTAAIDPVEETKVYKRFSDIVKNKTAVIVTHRLGSVKFANRIVVMKNGKIAGIGNHNELLASCSIYKDMWESQSQYYTQQASTK